MDFAPTTEQRLLVDSIRAFVERELYPYEDEVERDDAVRPELARTIRDKALAQGFYAANIPAEFGGGGLDAISLALMERELGRPSYALQAFVGRPSNILCACAGDQVAAYLATSVRGERVDCLAMTEPGAGSDLRSMATRAVRRGGDYVITGVKHFISHADIADFVILFAVTGSDETPRGPRNRVTAFLVDKGTPGFAVRRGAGAVSHRGYHHCELVFDGCRVGPGQVLGEEGQGFALVDTWLSASRLTVAAMCVGRAQRALEMATEWAATRRQFGRAIGRFQGTSFKLADMATEIAAAELLALNAAWKLDRGAMTGSDAAMAKLFASEMLARVTDQVVQIFGGMGLMQGTHAERFWRDARVERIWDGTSEIQRHIVSRALLRPFESQAEEDR